MRFLFASTPHVEPEPPLRAELLDLERLQDLARSLGLEHAALHGRRVRPTTLVRFHENARELARAHALLADDARTHAVGPAADWLLDNYHLIDAEVRSLRRDLPRGFYRQLPHVSEAGRPVPRISLLAQALIAHTDSRVDRRQLTAFLISYQTVRPLTLGELWAWPSLLRMALLENLRRLSDDILWVRQVKLEADRVIAELEAGASASGLRVPERGHIPFVSQLLHRLRDQAGFRTEARSALDAHLLRHDESSDELILHDHQHQATTQVLIANVITSLRLCASLDWPSVVEQVSLVENILRRDPAGTYARMDFASRDQQRKAVERLAPRDGEGQVRVATLAITHAQQHAADGQSREAHVGYHLIGPGRVEVQALAGRRVPLAERVGRVARDHATAAYLWTIAAGTGLLLFVADVAARLSGATPWQRVAVGVAFVIPFSEAILSLVHRAITAIITPHRLPRMDFERGLPPHARTMVIVPTLLTSRSTVDALLEQLHVAALANPDPLVHFAILSDFPDAVSADMPTDAALLAAAVNGVTTLNQETGGTRFFLFHRQRQWNPGEGAWMGWERKRGKIEEFNQLLRGSTETSYGVQIGATALLPSIRYCVTLDADTRLPRDAVRTLVGVIEHPLNRPRVDDRIGRVVEGYGILQPRVSVTMSSASGSLFSRLYAGHTAIDPYTTAVSDVYQDLFGEGIFTGKGLYNVDAFQRVLDGRVPENAILSHDLFEGLYARPALVSDVEVVDDYPSSLLAHFRRQHRWVRGDWQILGWLFPWVRERDGYARNRLPLISRWKILDNLRRSLAAPATFAALLVVWTVAPAHIWAWTLAALTPQLMPLVVRLLEVLASLVRGAVDRAAWLTLGDDLALGLARAAIDIALLPHNSFEMVDAIAVTLVRVVVTRRRLLEWETAAASAARVIGRDGWSFLWAMLASPALAAGVVVLVSVTQPSSLRAALPFAALWVAAPFIARILSRPRTQQRRALDANGRQFLETLARDTWQFFETHMTAEHHFLPPDNVQVVPDIRVAARTSPTNIGMALLSTLAAHDLGFIADADLARRLEATIDAVERLQRFEGHLLNWYDTRTLTPLPPAYVSTVDSGNFAGALITLAIGLEERATRPNEEPALATRFAQLAVRARAFAADMRFGFLYDTQRDLFAIGYRLADESGAGRLDGSHYDLLASEARLASFIAILKGDAPVRHWFRLGRPLTRVHGRAVLLSWSATMFEYLMPQLLMRSFPRTLLDDTCRLAIRRQIDYGSERAVPWGISESAYAAVDREQTYQYRAFGVPGLGLTRHVGDQTVVAPYATALALPFAAHEAVSNLQRLADVGARGGLGYFEAVDYSGQAPDLAEVGSVAATIPGAAPVIVRTYMSHHQGMTLVAIANSLTDDVMVDRFHRDAAVRATEMLLQERVPRAPSVLRDGLEAGDAPERSTTTVVPVRRYRSPRTDAPQAQFLSNGAYVTVVTNAGGGAARWRATAVTRWRRDATADPASQVLYLRDVRDGTVWSAGFQPMAVEADDYVATFHSDKATIRRLDGDMSTFLEVAVSPEDDVEVRRLTMHNRGNRLRELEVTSYAEMALAPLRDDLAHPAFAKLFIETEYSPENTALLCHRRPRTPGSSLWAVHVLSLEGRPHGPVEWETDRERFIGRGRTMRRPAALDGTPLSGSTGVVIDPICSLRTRVRIPPGRQVTLGFSTGVAPTREAAMHLSQKYHHPNAAARTFALAFTHAQTLRQHLGVSAEDVRTFERLASCLHYVDESARASGDLFAANRLGQPGLWRMGLSGDRPITLVRVVEGADGRQLVQTVLQAQEYWRLKGLASDTVIINEREHGYLDETHAHLTSLLAAGPWGVTANRPCGAFLLRRDRLTDDESRLLSVCARVLLTSDGGDLHAQLDRRRSGDRLAPIGSTVATPPVSSPTLAFTPPPPTPAPAIIVRDEATVAPPALSALSVGVGAFPAGRRGFQLSLTGERTTPAPWSNVIANPVFGTIVTAAGAAHTWAVNSRENRLTPFANDPVTDPTAEAVFLRDDATGECWTPTPGPLRCDSETRRVDVEHAPGVSRFRQIAHGVASRLDTFVHVSEPVKMSLLALTNQTATVLRISVYGYCEWILGPPRDGHALHVVTSRDRETGAIFARNGYSEGFAERVAFLASSLPPQASTADRTAFLGRCGELEAPAALDGRALTPRFGGGLDPCAVMRVMLTIEPGATVHVAFALGQGHDADHARALATRFASVHDAQMSLDAVEALWDRRLGAVTVRTPDDSFDLMMNGWLVYQTLSCRVHARSGYFQPSGAFGFRDQLQDVLALMHAEPGITRAHLLRAASRQFVEGDVQHWWHEPSGRGLRTRCSDDLLWLPYAVSEYVHHSGDDAVLDEVVPFLTAPQLEEGREESYDLPLESDERGTLLEHCQRAVKKAHTAGAHGLPLFGSGDWNDGMNLVGHEGRGESTWLGFFLHVVLRRVASLCDLRHLSAEAAAYRHEASCLVPALEAAWDGQWFRRGYFDDGTPLGSSLSDECRIDSIVQSWSVLSDAVPRRLSERAMDAVRTMLVSRQMQTVALLTPPFDHTSQEPGYIKGYPPGLRENGGQYTHASVWFVMALAHLDAGDEAMDVFHMLNPINRSRRRSDVDRYRAEPYVVVGDVYTHPSHQGRGGWSWYTGSAGWLYRVGLESLLGLRRQGATFSIDPCVPAGWPHFEITWRVGEATYEIRVGNRHGTCRGVERAELNGRPVDPSAIPIAAAGVHQVSLEMGSNLTRPGSVSALRSRSGRHAHATE